MSTDAPPPIHRAIRLEPGQGRVLIERWTLSDEPRLRNIARRDAEGLLMWRADLPDTVGRECFVAIQRIGNAILATTYQGAKVLLDLSTGAHIETQTTARQADVTLRGPPDSTQADHPAYLPNHVR